jgi:hypothetical protein
MENFKPNENKDDIVDSLKFEVTENGKFSISYERKDSELQNHGNISNPQFFSQIFLHYYIKYNDKIHYPFIIINHEAKEVRKRFRLRKGWITCTHSFKIFNQGDFDYFLKKIYDSEKYYNFYFHAPFVKSEDLIRINLKKIKQKQKMERLENEL